MICVLPIGFSLYDVKVNLQVTLYNCINARFDVQ